MELRLADPLRFMACLETLASTDYSLCIKAGVHYTLCGGKLLLSVSHCCVRLVVVPIFTLCLAVARTVCIHHACSGYTHRHSLLRAACTFTSLQPLFAVRLASDHCGHAGTIAKLGTQKHHDEWLPRMDTLDLPGCFG